MNKRKIIFRGKRENIEELVHDLSNLEGVDQVSVEDVTSFIPDMLDRDPQRQVELVDVMIAFTINLTSNYVYDQIRTVLRNRAARRGFTEQQHEEKDDQQEDKNHG